MTEKNIIKEFLDDLICDWKQFKPKKDFYNATKINPHRWGQLMRNKKSPTYNEIKDIAKYFDAKIEVLLSKKQLKLFEEEEK